MTDSEAKGKYPNQKLSKRLFLNNKTFDVFSYIFLELNNKR